MLEQEVRMKDGSQAIVNSLGDIAMAGSAASGKISILVYTIPKLLLFSWGYVLYAIVDCTIGCIRGMGFATTPTLLNIFCITAPRLLWNFFIFPLNPNLFWLHICIPISYVLCMVAQVIYYRHCRKIVNSRISAA